MPHLTLLLSRSVLLSCLFIHTALAANMQAASQANIVQPSMVAPESSVAASTSASQITPSTIPANGDPCGPAHQETPNFPNTCDLVPSLVTSPAPYGINCTATVDVVKYPKLALQWSNVEASIYNICVKMEDSRTLTGKWVWSMLAPRAAIGFFLPPFQGSAARPSMKRCLQIFAAMNNTCATTTTPSDYGSINLRTMPGLDPNWYGSGAKTPPIFGDGSAVNVGYISYAISKTAG